MLTFIKLWKLIHGIFKIAQLVRENSDETQVLPRKALSEKSESTLVFPQIFSILGIPEKMQNESVEFGESSESPKHGRSTDFLKKTSHTFGAAKG